MVSKYLTPFSTKTKMKGSIYKGRKCKTMYIKATIEFQSSTYSFKILTRTLTSQHAAWARHWLDDIAVLEAELPVEDATE